MADEEQVQEPKVLTPVAFFKDAPFGVAGNMVKKDFSTGITTVGDATGNATEADVAVEASEGSGTIETVSASVLNDPVAEEPDTPTLDDAPTEEPDTPTLDDAPDDDGTLEL